jgi:PAS domain S-box-containing protein
VGVEQLLVGVGETATDREAQDGLRIALRDPSLQLVLWREEHHGYVDVEGRPFELPVAGDLRVATFIESEQQGKLAAFVHDRAVLADRELLASVAAAARLALQRNRLQSELHARVVELERERDFIRDVVNATPAFFAVVDPDARIVRFNAALVAACGIPDDERVRGLPFADVFAAARDRRQVASLITRQSQGRHQHSWLSRDDTDLVVEWSVIPIADDHGRPRLLISGLDVTERARHEEELQRERDFLSSVGKATPSLLCVVHADGTVDSRGVNLAFAAATGFDDAKAVGHRFWDLIVSPEHVDSVRAAFNESVASGAEIRRETPWRAVGGGELIVEWWTSSLAAWRTGHYLISGTDVTKRRRDEDELRRSRTRLVEAGDAERRRLERNLHDGAQQHLVSMALTLRLAEAGLGDAVRAGTLLAEASAELALALKELRELARGLHPATLTNHGLGAALEALASRSSVPVDLRLDFDERLPEPIEVCVFYAVSEALANVAKYARATAVTVHLGRGHGHVFVSVADDGVGGAAPERGSGLLGLADRVAALDGSIEITSAPGQGTSICATLPLQSGPATQRYG